MFSAILLYKRVQVSKHIYVFKSVGKVVFGKDGAQVEEAKRHERISISLATR